VNQKILNLSSVRDMKNLRKDKSKKLCLVKFPEAAKEYLMNEKWLTIEEVREIAKSKDWNTEIPDSFLDKLRNFFIFW
jgi:hypothetical protein